MHFMHFLHKPRARRVLGHTFSVSRSPVSTPSVPTSVRQRVGLHATCGATANGAYAHMPHQPPSWRLLDARRGAGLGFQESCTTGSFRATQSNFNQMPFVKFDAAQSGCSRVCGAVI
jgi:hypothetical protein